VAASRIHATAVIAEGASLHPSVSVGAYAVIGPEVVIGEGSEIMAHAVVSGRTHMGKANRVFTGAVIGMDPQDLKYAGEKSRLEIGDSNTFREFVTCHPGTGDGGVTRIGDRNLLMVGVHVAHDCRVGNDVVISNSVGLAGHVEIADHVVVGGITGFHQYVRVGRLAMVGGGLRIVADIPPFCLVDGNPAYVTALNRVGLKRSELDEATQKRLAAAFRILFRRKLPIQSAVAALKTELGDAPPVAELVSFIAATKRGITRALPVRGAKEGAPDE